MSCFKLKVFVNLTSRNLVQTKVTSPDWIPNSYQSNHLLLVNKNDENTGDWQLGLSDIMNFYWKVGPNQFSILHFTE